MSAKLPALMQPYWFEVAVPIPGSNQRVVLHTGPLTVEGVTAALKVLESLTDQQGLDTALTAIEHAAKSVNKSVSDL